jgi:hypothetical protein
LHRLSIDARLQPREYLELPRDDGWIFLHLLGEQGSTHQIKRDYPSDR